MSNKSQSIDTQLGQEFALAIHGFIFQCFNVRTFRETVLFCLDVAKTDLAAKSKCELDSVATIKPVAEVLATIEKKLGREVVESLYDGAATRKLLDARQAIEASTVVFAFSLLDALLDKLYGLALRANHAALLEALGEKTVSITNLLKIPADKLIQEKLQEHLEQFQEKSIRQKADRLYSVCKPSPGEVFMDDYSFEPTVLEQFRDLRVSIVHGQHLASPVENSSKWIDFAFRTGCHFGAMVGRKCGLVALAGNDFFADLTKQTAWSQPSNRSEET